MFKKIGIMVTMLCMLLTVSLFAGPWVDVDSDDDISWMVEYSDGLGTTYGSGDQTLNACGHEGQTVTLYVDGSAVDSGTVSTYENGWLYLEVPFGLGDDDDPITD